MVKFTKDSVIIEIKTLIPVDTLTDLQSAILDVVTNKFRLESQSDDNDLQTTKSDSYAYYKLLDFYRDISFSFETNEDIYNTIHSALSKTRKQENESK